MSSRKNGDIRGFFASGAPSSSQTQNQQPASSQPSISDLPSSPSTPPRSNPRVFSRNEEIKGSDDDDSDDSLGSITNILGHRAGPSAHQRDANVLSTPQAKRIASSDVHRSPLTLQPKRHRFDLKALINHSKEIQRTEESVKRADALIAREEKNSGASADDSETENDPRRLEEAAYQLFNGGDDEEGKGEKLRRALKRSNGDNRSSSKHCYFFNQEGPFSKPSKIAFPRKKAVGRWKCLSQSDTRYRIFIMGLPYMFVSQGEALPDELFQWILDEICTEQNAELRRQYINLTELCEDNTCRLVNDMQLYAMLERIGGPKYAREHNKFKSTTEVRQGYLDQNWTSLVTFLQLLERIAPGLQTAPAISAVQLLVRMGLDPVVALIVREDHMRAMTALVSRLATSRSQWNTACNAICSYVYENIDDLELKVTALLSIPSSTLHLLDLRRRIAAESLFREPGLGGKPIDPFLSFERIRNRLDEDDFKSTNKASFDFEQLRALTTLLDIVINRGDFMRPSSNTKTNESKLQYTTTPPPSKKTSKSRGEHSTEDKRKDVTQSKSTEAEAEQKFNAEIDVLAARVKAIHDKIRDRAERKDVKLGLLGLEKRLKCAVRTRPPLKKEIFASEGTLASEAELNVPKQRDFMRQWALKKKAEREGREGGITGFTAGGTEPCKEISSCCGIA